MLVTNEMFKIGYQQIHIFEMNINEVIELCVIY